MKRKATVCIFFVLAMLCGFLNPFLGLFFSVGSAYFIYQYEKKRGFLFGEQIASIAIVVCFLFGILMAQVTDNITITSKLNANLAEKKDTIFENIQYDENLSSNEIINEINPSEEQTANIYITNTGGKYHYAGCSHLRKSKIEMTLKEALEQGYTACSRCKPK